MFAVPFVLGAASLIIAYDAALAGTCPAALKVVRPIDGAEVGLHEVVEVAVAGRPVKVAVLVRAAHKEWWVQEDSSAARDGRVAVVAQFGERGIGLGEIFEIVALVDPDFDRSSYISRGAPEQIQRVTGRFLAKVLVHG